MFPLLGLFFLLFLITEVNASAPPDVNLLVEKIFRKERNLNVEPLLWQLRFNILNKNREEAKRVLEKLKEKLETVKGKEVVLSLTVERLETVSDLREIDRKLSEAEVLCRQHRPREAGKILSSLYSEIRVVKKVLPKGELEKSLLLLEELFKPKVVSYTAALSVVDTLLSRIEERTEIYPIPLWRLKVLLEGNTERKSTWEEAYRNLQMAYMLGYIGGEGYKNLKEVILRALKRFDEGEKPLKETTEIRVLLKSYLPF